MFCVPFSPELMERPIWHCFVRWRLLLNNDRRTRAAVSSESLIVLLICSFKLFVLHQLMFHITNVPLECWEKDVRFVSYQLSIVLSKIQKFATLMLRPGLRRNRKGDHYPTLRLIFFLLFIWGWENSFRSRQGQNKKTKHLLLLKGN